MIEWAGMEDDFGVELASQAEKEFEKYEYETWQEDERSWSPLITLEQLSKRPNLEVEWYCPDWIPVGAKTILNGEPKCGKTILLMHILKNVVQGTPFCGIPTEKARVLYLTEQTEHEFKMQASEVPGLMGDPNFYVLLAEEQPKEMVTWQQTLNFADKMIKLIGAKIVVFDTFGGMAKLPPGGENDSATIQNHINQLNFLFKHRYLATVLTHHNRKKSDDPKQQSSNLSISSARGSSAFIGGGGHIIMMNDETGGAGRTRNFAFFGRYKHGTSKRLELDTHGEYRDLATLPAAQRFQLR